MGSMAANKDHRAQGKDGDIAAAVTLLKTGLAAVAALPPGLARDARTAHADAVATLIGALDLPPPVQDPIDRMDRSRLDRLLQLAGPVQGAELLAQLAQDLARIGDALDRAAAVVDADSLRRETHILIALAGSVGAHGLEQDARALNRAANDPSISLDDGLPEALRRGLAGLQAEIAARCGADGAGQ